MRDPSRSLARSKRAWIKWSRNPSASPSLCHKCIHWWQRSCNGTLVDGHLDVPSWATVLYLLKARGAVRAFLANVTSQSANVAADIHPGMKVSSERELDKKLAPTICERLRTQYDTSMGSCFPQARCTPDDILKGHCLWGKNLSAS